MKKRLSYAICKWWMKKQRNEYIPSRPSSSSFFILFVKLIIKSFFHLHLRLFSGIRFELKVGREGIASIIAFLRGLVPLTSNDCEEESFLHLFKIQLRRRLFFSSASSLMIPALSLLLSRFSFATVCNTLSEKLDRACQTQGNMITTWKKNETTKRMEK